MTPVKLSRVADVLTDADYGPTIRAIVAQIRSRQLVVTAGNGGSAALASHLVQAVQKPSLTRQSGIPGVCLTDNVALLTAWANDRDFASALLEIFRPWMPRRGVLVAITSSGNSENIVRLVRCALTEGWCVAGLTGFDGGQVEQLVSLSLHVASHDYGNVETMHQLFIHAIQELL